jgi:hypothetical protein
VAELEQQVAELSLELAAAVADAELYRGLYHDVVRRPDAWALAYDLFLSLRACSDLVAFGGCEWVAGVADAGVAHYQYVCEAAGR